MFLPRGRQPSADTCQNSCEGQIFLGSAVADENGNFYYSDTLIGSITATSTDSLGRTSEFAECILVDTLATVISQSETAGQLLLFPNPTSDYFRITEVKSSFPLSLCVINSLGKEVLRQEGVNESETSIDVSTLSTGIYLVIVRCNERVLTEAIAVERKKYFHSTGSQSFEIVLDSLWFFYYSLLVTCCAMLTSFRTWNPCVLCTSQIVFQKEEANSYVGRRKRHYADLKNHRVDRSMRVTV